MRRFSILSGCSGGGKTTLLQALAARGFSVIPEPGRRIVAQELAGTGAALPWVNAEAFARRAVALSLADYKAAQALPGRVFFDRGLGDALAALDHATGQVGTDTAAVRTLFDPRVFMLPPWPEIFVHDAERQGGWDEAVAEYERLCAFYPRLGFAVVTVPKMPVPGRVDRILAHLGV